MDLAEIERNFQREGVGGEVAVCETNKIWFCGRK